MKQIIFALLTVLSVAAHAQLSKLDDGLNPVEKWVMGSRAQGAYSVYSPLFCSREASQKYLKTLVSEKAELFPSGPTAATMTTSLNSIINSAQNLLVLAGDKAAKERQICTGFYTEKKSHIGNALSMGNGYLVFDFRLFQHLYSLPDSERSSWVVDFVTLHEFAHQLQYWNNDEEVAKTFAGKQTAKTPELAADCVAGALLTMKNAGLSPEIFDMSYKGALNAAFKLGDYNVDSSGHHGTPVDRYLATNAGRKFVEDHLKLFKTLGGLTSENLLKRCNRAAQSPI